MKPIIQAKLSSGSASHWNPREISSIANPLGQPAASARRRARPRRSR
jgi:hypothetical protein